MKKLFVVLLFMTFSISEAYSKERNITDFELNTSEILLAEEYEEYVDCFDLAYAFLLVAEGRNGGQFSSDRSIYLVNQMMAEFYQLELC